MSTRVGKTASETRAGGSVVNPVEIESLNRDEDRATLEAFFSENIPDPTRITLSQRAKDPHRGHRSHILAIRDGGMVLGGLYAAPPVLEVEDLREKPGFTALAEEGALRTFVMLYAVAVRSGHRREGLGNALTRALENRLDRTDVRIIYGVCAADSAPFYRGAGFEVLPPEQAFVTKWGGLPVGFPIKGDAQWFFKKLPR